MRDGSYEVKGSGIRVMAVLKQGKDGIEKLHLSGRDANDVNRTTHIERE